MSITNISVKKLNENVILPKYSTIGSAGADLFAFINENIILKAGKSVMVPTGICFAIPSGFEVQIRSRSGLAAKNGIFVLNGIGTIDSDYRGELKVILANFSDTDFIIEPKMRIAQMVVSNYSQAHFEIVDDLESTTRGTGGFGSTGS